MKQSILFLLATFMFACAPNQIVETKDENGQVLERYEVEKKTGQKNGSYQRLIKDVVVETATYLHDTLDGIRVLFDADGLKEIEETYQRGTYHGKYYTYYPDGSLKMDGQYENGTMEGNWQKFYQNGQLMEVVAMHLNQENGPFTEYWENGKIKAEGTYLDGDNEHGELKLYDQQGTLEKIMQCERGVCHTTWKKEMSPSQ